MFHLDFKIVMQQGTSLYAILAVLLVKVLKRDDLAPSVGQPHLIITNSHSEAVFHQFHNE